MEKSLIIILDEQLCQGMMWIQDNWVNGVHLQLLGFSFLWSMKWCDICSLKQGSSVVLASIGLNPGSECLEHGHGLLVLLGMGGCLLTSIRNSVNLQEAFYIPEELMARETFEMRSHCEEDVV